MRNFPINESRTLWFSRSIACSMYLFVYDKSTKDWYILVSQRGPGCPSAVGKWNVPGGYLDFDETLEDAARRECFEETGVMVTDPITLASISTDLKSKKQNVVCSFFAIKKVNDLSEIQNQFTYDNNAEQNEVTDISLWRVGYFYELPDAATKEMAFKHDQMIREIFDKRINVNLIDSYFINFVERNTKINLNIE